MLRSIYLINGITDLLVCVFCFYLAYIGYKKSKNIEKFIATIGILYFVSAILNLMWFIKALNFSELDAFILESLFICAKAALFLVVVFLITGKKSLIYLLALFLFSSFAIQITFTDFILLLNISSNLLFVIVFFILFSEKDEHLKNCSIYGILYSLFSLTIGFLFLFEKKANSYLWLANILFCLSIYQMSLYIKKKAFKTSKSKENRYIIFLKFLIFLFSISGFLIISVISIHEMGHALTAKYYKCDESRAIIYDISDFPHTETECSGNYNDFILTLNGIFAPIILSLIFIMIGNSFIRNSAQVMIGFSLLFSYGDLVVLKVSNNLIYANSLIGIVIVIIGLVQLSQDYLKEMLKT